MQEHERRPPGAAEVTMEEFHHADTKNAKAQQSNLDKFFALFVTSR